MVSGKFKMAPNNQETPSQPNLNPNPRESPESQLSFINTLLAGTVHSRLSHNSNSQSIEYQAGKLAKQLGYQPYEEVEVTLTIKPKIR